MAQLVQPALCSHEGEDAWALLARVWLGASVVPPARWPRLDAAVTASAMGLVFRQLCPMWVCSLSQWALVSVSLPRD